MQWNWLGYDGYEVIKPKLHRSIDAPMEDSSTAIHVEPTFVIGEPVIIYCLENDVKEENDLHIHQD